GAYIFSYKNDKLEIKKALSGLNARRAVYLNDYLYVVADNKITVLNEFDWEKVRELELETAPQIKPTPTTWPIPTILPLPF
ncbi:MAG: hypothetical protein Q8L57_03130, partial [bacterium]|nr:hypothetical protein [bacterium]